MAAPQTDKTKTELAATMKRMAELEKELEARDRHIEDLEAEAQAIRDQGGLKFNAADIAFEGPHGDEFLVTPHLNREDQANNVFKHLKPKKVKAVDESEAIRWYLQSHESSEGSGKPLDPVRVRVTATAVGDARRKRVQLKRQLVNLRNKLESGNMLSDREQELLNEYEADIYGYDKEEL